jgi:hypothetical protein
VETDSIVEAFDEGEQVVLGIGPGRIFAVMDEFGFERVEDPLDRGIVETISFSAHRWAAAGKLQRGTIAV